MRFGWFIAVLGLSVVASGCKKKVPDVPVVTPTPPSAGLQVVSVEPSTIPPGQATPVTVYGSGFQNGASVSVGDSTVSGVSFQSSSALGLTAPALSAGSYDITVTNPDGASDTLVGGLRVGGTAGSECDLVRVHFDFDQSSLTSAAKGTLDKYAYCFEQRQGAVRIEGHCDERGTTEYNLALGERRARSVQSYLQGKGIAPSRIKTISYGEERPVERASTESAWAVNRRADTSVSP